jgi:outer membrane protein TolC
MAALVKNNSTAARPLARLLLIVYTVTCLINQTALSQVIDNQRNTEAEDAPKLRGLGPSGTAGTGQAGSSNQTGAFEPSASSGQIGAHDLDILRGESLSTEGAIFIKPDEVMVHPPVLSALIQVNRVRDPYHMDARTERPITLGDVVKIAISNNLDIKIRHTEEQSQKWTYYSSLGGFLPDLSSQFNYETLSGKYASPFGVITNVSTPHMTIPVIAQWTLFKGGSIIFGAAEHRHNYRASQYALKGTTNDVLLEAADLYYHLALNDILLQIRIKAVETANALLLRNEERFANGAATKLDVLQAKTLLSRTRQQLINQQVERRRSAVRLATALNLDAGEDLTTGERLISQIRLIDENSKIADLLQVAIDHRPELKKYEQLRLAAKDAVKVAFAPLLPQVVGSAGASTTGARAVSASSSANNSSSASTAALGAGSFSTSTAAPVGGTTSKARRFGVAEIYQLGVGVQWTLGGMGFTEAAQVQSARWQARKAQYDFSRELNRVYAEVRDAYLETVDAENQIDATTEAVTSSAEQVEVSNIRLAEGVGTDLDAVNAQRDYTQALIDKASAIIHFNIAQARLLRAMGIISGDTLTASKPRTVL